MPDLSDVLGDLAYKCGKLTVRTVKGTQRSIIEEAQIEEDLLELMAQLWGKIEARYEVYLYGAERTDEDNETLNLFREFWANGFLDEVFPLRALA